MHGKGDARSSQVRGEQCLALAQRPCRSGFGTLTGFGTLGDVWGKLGGCIFAILLVACTSEAGSEKKSETGSVAKGQTQNEPGEKASPKASLATEENSSPPIEELKSLEMEFEVFSDVSLVSSSDCASIAGGVEEIFAQIAAQKLRLGVAVSRAEAVAVLSELSSAIGNRVESMGTIEHDAELRRLSGEVQASFGDLSESLRLLGDAITARDSQATAVIMRRIRNGIGNTRSSVEGLVAACQS